MNTAWASVETSAFCVKQVAMNKCIGTLSGIRYRIRMMGIPMSCPLCICRDNVKIIHNNPNQNWYSEKKQLDVKDEVLSSNIYGYSDGKPN